MVNQSNIEVKNGYLLVTAKGDRNDFMSVINGTKIINEAAKLHNINYVLADYRFIKYNVPLSDAFNLVKLFDQKIPSFGNLTIGAVTNEHNMELAKYWESICHKRGYHYKVFPTFQEAEDWILMQIKEHSLSNS